MRIHLIFGLFPALQATRRRESLTITATTATSRPRQLLGRALVVGQVVLSVLLLSGAGLFIRTLHNLRARDLGFQPARLLQVRLDAEAADFKPEQLPQVYHGVLRSVRSAPGVASASMSHSGFRTGISRTCCIAVEGHPMRPGRSREVRTNSVEPGYFQTVQLPIVLGRTFTAHDISDPPRSAIISRSAARQFFGGTPPIGKRIGWGDPPKLVYDIEVIGIAEDANIGNLREDMLPVIYFAAERGRVLHVRTACETSAVSAAIQQAIQSTDRNVLVRGMRTITEIVDSALVIERLMAKLASFFGVLALVLSAIGLYGIVNYSVARRTQEIGSTMALGARRSTILRMVAVEVASLAVIGIGIGVPASIASARTVSSMLFGVDPGDTATIAAATAVLAVAAGVAAYVPGRRAASVDGDASATVRIAWRLFPQPRLRPFTF